MRGAVGPGARTGTVPQEIRDVVGDVDAVGPAQGFQSGEIVFRPGVGFRHGHGRPLVIHVPGLLHRVPVLHQVALPENHGPRSRARTAGMRPGEFQQDVVALPADGRRGRVDSESRQFPPQSLGHAFARNQPREPGEPGFAFGLGVGRGGAIQIFFVLSDHRPQQFRRKVVFPVDHPHPVTVGGQQHVGQVDAGPAVNHPAAVGGQVRLIPQDLPNAQIVGDKGRVQEPVGVAAPGRSRHAEGRHRQDERPEPGVFPPRRRTAPGQKFDAGPETARDRRRQPSEGGQQRQEQDRPPKGGIPRFGGGRSGQKPVHGREELTVTGQRGRPGHSRGENEVRQFFGQGDPPFFKLPLPAEQQGQEGVVGVQQGGVKNRDIGRRFVVEQDFRGDQGVPPAFQPRVGIVIDRQDLPQTVEDLQIRASPFGGRHSGPPGGTGAQGRPGALRRPLRRRDRQGGADLPRPGHRHGPVQRPAQRLRRRRQTRFPIAAPDRDLGTVQGVAKNQGAVGFEGFSHLGGHRPGQQKRAVGRQQDGKGPKAVLVGLGSNPAHRPGEGAFQIKALPVVERRLGHRFLKIESEHPGFQIGRRAGGPIGGTGRGLLQEAQRGKGGGVPHLGHRSKNAQGR